MVVIDAGAVDLVAIAAGAVDRVVAGAVDLVVAGAVDLVVLDAAAADLFAW